MQRSGADEEQQVEEGSRVPHLQCEMCVDLCEIYSSLGKGLYRPLTGDSEFFFLLKNVRRSLRFGSYDGFVQVRTSSATLRAASRKHCTFCCSMVVSSPGWSRAELVSLQSPPQFPSRRWEWFDERKDMLPANESEPYA